MAALDAICFDSHPGLRSGCPLKFSRITWRNERRSAADTVAAGDREITFEPDAPPSLDSIIPGYNRLR